MNKKEILHSIAAILVLAGTLGVFALPNFGSNIFVLVTITVLILLIVSAFYLGFAPDIKEDTHRKKRQRFEIAGVVVILVCLPVQFFYPKAGLLLVLPFLAVLYWFFFWRPASRKKNGCDRL
jgi:chromate transport protein ChrA